MKRFEKVTTLSLLLFGMLVGGSASAEKSLIFCSVTNPDSFNPQTVTTGNTMTRPLFNNLVEFKVGTSDLIPGLAESYSRSDDGLVYLFRLRRNVWFHSNALFVPTRPFNADDVLFSIERQWKDDHPFHKVGAATYRYFDDMSWGSLLKAVEKIDDHTVRITLNRPEAPFLADLAMPFASILSAEYAETLLKAGKPETLDEVPIGTGPFRFVSFEPDRAIRYVSFDKYWEGRQPLDNLIFTITPNAAVRLNKLRSGDCHVMVFPSPAELAKIDRDANLIMQQRDGLNLSYMAFNTQKPPLDDPRVRRAIILSIDKQTLVDAIYQGGGHPAKNPIPPGMWSFDDRTDDLPFDPEQARRLLAEAKRSEGFSLSLWYPSIARAYMPDGKRSAEIIKADLERVGIKVSLVTDDWKDYRRRISEGEHDMAIAGWASDNGDPDNFFSPLLSCSATRPGGGNYAKWCDPAFDAAITAAKRAGSREERIGHYRDAQRIFHRELPWLPIASSGIAMALRKEVRNYLIDPFLPVFTGVDIESGAR